LPPTTISASQSLPSTSTRSGRPPRAAADRSPCGQQPHQSSALLPSPYRMQGACKTYSYYVAFTISYLAIAK
jgi:hypothetical protein